MTLPKNASPEARRKKHESDRRVEANQQRRIRNKQLDNDDRADPEYYNDIERKLRELLPGFVIDYAPNETICRYNRPNGNNVVVKDDTRPGALLRIWWAEMPVEF